MSRITGSEVVSLMEAYQKVYESKVESTQEVEQLDEITADLALRASKAADRKRAQLAAAQDKSGAAAKAAQASRLYTKQAKKRLANEEVEDFESILEEIVEELLEDCLEFGYELDESLELIENATLEYFDEIEDLEEATVTYGSDTESPEQRKARAKEKHTAMKSSARKAAVKGAVERVKAKVSGAKAAAGIAGSIAKDEAKRAGRAAAHGVGKAVSAARSAASEKKAQVKSGVKKMLGRGLRAAAGGAGKVAQMARKAGSAAGKAAERLGEEAVGNRGLIDGRNKLADKAIDKSGRKVPTTKHGMRMVPTHHSAARLPSGDLKTKAKNKAKKDAYYQNQRYGQGSVRMEEVEVDVFDLVLEYLLETGHAETISEAEYIMAQMDSDVIQSIAEETLTEKLAKGTKGVSFATGKHQGGYDQAMTQKNPRTGRQRKTSPEMKAIGAHSKAKSAQWKAEREGDHDKAARNRERRERIAHVVYNKTRRIIDRADND